MTLTSIARGPWLLAVGVPALLAQGPTYTITPDAAPPGVSREVRVTAPTTAPVTVPAAGCLFESVHTGGPDGPLALSTPCGAPVPVTVLPCGVATQTWVPPPSLPPGTYWLKCPFTDPTTLQQQTRWLDLRIDAPAVTGLVPSDQPELGATWVLALQSPGAPSAFYVAAASLTTDEGIPIGLADPLTLDPDVLFELSFPSPEPSLFSGFQGTLDAAGSATLLVHVPGVPALDCVGIHVQAVVVGPQGLVLSNCVDAVMLST